MPISQNDYIDITSVVAGAAATSARTLITRLITVNDLLPTLSLVNFSSADAVGNYFGFSSEEYTQAAYYFSLLTKDGRRPNSIQFARWADVDTSAQVFGAEVSTLDQLKTYTTGAFDITLGGSTFNLTGLDFSGAADYAAVATILQTDIRLLDASLDAVTVTYDAVRKSFNFDTTKVIDGAISFTAVTASLLDDLGWNALAIFSAGIAAQTLTEMQSAATTTNNNYYGFATIDQLTLDEHVELATWNITKNNEYQYSVRSTTAEAITWSPALIGFAGTSLTLIDGTSTYPWIHPLATVAANVWTQRGAAMNLMFTQSTSPDPAVIDNSTDKATYDALRANYFGETQVNGTNLTFYQNGILMGGLTSPQQMGVYAAEAWFKSNTASGLINLLLALKILSADTEGEAQVTSVLNASAELGVFNGMISVGKVITTEQKASITEISGDANAWQTVQREGYWFTTSIESEVVNSITVYTITYTLIYAKRDGVSKIEGRDILI